MAKHIAPPDPLPPDNNIGPLLLAITYVLLFFVLVTSVLRVYVRTEVRLLGLDDLTIVAATVLSIARVVIQIIQCVCFGNGRHRWYLGWPHDETKYQMNDMLGWVAQILLFLLTALVKISICILMLRIKNTRNLKLILGTVAMGLVVTNLGCVVILLAECSPIDTYWTGREDGTCWDTRVRIYAIYFTIAFSLATDLLCSSLPLAIMWKVRVPFATKAKLCGLMSLGLVATAFGAVRASSLGTTSVDLSWDYAIVAIWSNLEIFLSLIAANLATAPIVYKFFREGRAVVEPLETKRASSNMMGSGNKTDPKRASTPRGGGLYFPPPANNGGRHSPFGGSEASDMPLSPMQPNRPGSPVGLSAPGAGAIGRHQNVKFGNEVRIVAD